MTRRDFLAAAPAAASAAPGRRPNIVFLCSDQHNTQVIRCHGHPLVRTPHLDRLAAMGVDFRRAYSVNPVCVPARAALMSGMYGSDVGSYCNSTPFDGRVPTWSNHLREAGYLCWSAGKLDLTRGKDYGLQEATNGHGHDIGPDITSLFRRPLCYRVGERKMIDGRTRTGPHHDASLAARGLEFLRTTAPASKPWAMYLGLLLPHPPFVARADLLELYPEREIALPRIPPDHLESLPLPLQALRNFKLMSTPIPEQRVRRARAAYYAMVTEMDALLGQVLDAVEQSGEMDNTLFVYTSDHGECLGEHGLWLKNNLLEPAARVPLILAGAGLPKGKTIDTPVSHVDLTATLMDIGGTPVPPRLRGRSLLPLARGTPGDHPGFAYAESHSEGNSTGSFMIRKGPWKYIHFTWHGNLLFNVEEDPGELHNLSGMAAHARVEKELHQILLSRVDPEAVTRQAFAAQERKLEQLIRDRSHDEFVQLLRGRLGEAQARALADLHYKRS